jgi:formylglycine-generating enzyme required for sulfatase activity
MRLDVTSLLSAGIGLGVMAGCGGRSPAPPDRVSSESIVVSAGFVIVGADCRPGRIEPGCDRASRDARTPLFLDSFVIDRDLAREGDYRRCVVAGACPEPSVSEGTARRLSAAVVVYESARDYCRWIGGSLPSRDQFERIARGTDGSVSPWGNGPSPCGDSRPSDECLRFEGPAGARSVALVPQWADGGFIVGASVFAFEAERGDGPAAFRCVRNGKK